MIIEVNFGQYNCEENILFPESGVLDVIATYKDGCSHSPKTAELIVNGEKIKILDKWGFTML